MYLISEIDPHIFSKSINLLKLQISPDYAHKEPLLTNKISAMIDQFKQRKVSPKKIRACKEVKYHGKLSFNNDI